MSQVEIRILRTIIEITSSSKSYIIILYNNNHRNVRLFAILLLPQN